MIAQRKQKENAKRFNELCDRGGRVIATSSTLREKPEAAQLEELERNTRGGQRTMSDYGWTVNNMLKGDTEPGHFPEDEMPENSAGDAAEDFAGHAVSTIAENDGWRHNDDE
jgi:hypothetical protein